MRKATLIRLLPIVAVCAASLAIFTPSSLAGGTTTTSTTATSAVAPTGAFARITGTYHVDKLPVTITGRAVHIDMHEWPYFAGQEVTLTAWANGHVFKTRKLYLKDAGNGKYGLLKTTVKAPRAGKVWITLKHPASTSLQGFKISHWYRVLAPHAAYGARGLFVQLMQQRLRQLHIFIYRTGVFDDQTGWALDAYHRLVGDGVARTFSRRIVNDLLDGKGRFHVRFPHQGRHAEGDLTKQLLALIVGSKVDWILPISSGKESTPTILGSFQIYARQPEYTSDGMYFSDFFHGGYAIHGYNPAPDYPASHGCMRLWMNDAIPVYNWLALGDWVDSYGNAPFYLGEGDL